MKVRLQPARHFTHRAAAVTLRAMPPDLEAEKRAAARAAAELVERGMTVGLGTGSTVAHLLPVLAERDLDLTCVATSVATEHAARGLGLRIVAFDAVAEF